MLCRRIIRAEITRMLGIIGGSGLDRIEGLEIRQHQPCATPYGEPSAPLQLGVLRGCPVIFLPRHGDQHTIAPHRINYRANLWAMHAHGVRHLVAVAAVGGINAAMGSGGLVVPDQIIDYTHGRESTFHDGVGNPLSHVDFTLPFCAALRKQLLAAGRAAGHVLHDGGTYGATQGPRLETAAEIDRMERDGADIVGMTGMPEAVLARELGLCYAMLALVVNAAAGRGNNAQGVSMAEIEATAKTGMVQVLEILGVLGQGHAG
jgi:5'-methylthioadenosine phosphorylase